MKKFITILGLALLAVFRGPAQVVTVQISLTQNQFLPAEALPVTVQVFNTSGQTLHLGADNQWLTFSVQSMDDNASVVKHSQPPVAGAFDVGSAEVAIKHVDLEPYFDLKKTGRYRITAFVHIPEWNADVTSNPQEFDVIDGVELWSQEFGLPMPAGVTNQMPEVRKYVLQQANYLEKQLRMYLLVTDASGGQIYKVSAIGPMVSFSQPEAELDSDSNLHLIYQSGSQSFLYSIITPAGNIISQEIYDYYNTRPHLSMDGSGKITIVGGVRRVKPGEVPLIVTPAPLPVAPNK
ncbi:MAG: hypothetical protein ACLQSR_06930 [Limisphaerales bacterium]